MAKKRDTLPTLTEVIDVRVDPAHGDSRPMPLAPDSVPIGELARAAADGGASLAAQVLEALRPRIDALIDSQVQEALAPHVLRLADVTVQRARDELAAALPAMVAQAVQDLLARRHKP